MNKEKQVHFGTQCQLKDGVMALTVTFDTDEVPPHAVITALVMNARAMGGQLGLTRHEVMEHILNVLKSPLEDGAIHEAN